VHELLHLPGTLVVLVTAADFQTLANLQAHYGQKEANAASV
jgi:hypothetical protein